MAELTPAAPGTVAAVIPTLHGGAKLAACLDSLSWQTWPRLSVYVVHNGSDPAVVPRRPGVAVVAAGRNLGFAGACNLGMRQALADGADHVLLLNDDASAEPETVATLVAATRDASVAAVSPVITFADGDQAIWFAGGHYDPSKAHDGRPYGYGRADLHPAGTYETGWVNGCAMLMPRAAVERVGELDADLFLYIEDIDWSLRARALGMRLRVAAGAPVRHHVSRSSGGATSETIAYYAARNTLIVNNRHAPSSGWPARARDARTLAVHLAHVRRSSAPAANARAVLAAWRDFRRGLAGPRHAPHPLASALGAELPSATR